MKKLIAIVLCLIMVMSMSACASGGSKTPAADGEWKWERRVEIMIPAGEGGGLDTSMRKFATYLEKELGTTVTIINKSGSVGVTGFTWAHNASNDGYAFQYTAPSAVISAAQGMFDFDLMADLIPVNGLMSAEGMFFGRVNAPWTDGKSMLEYAKAHPGEVTVAVDSPNGISGAIISELEKAAGVQFKWITSDSSEGYISVIAGDIDLCINTWTDAGAYAQSGDLNALLVMADHRNSVYPDVISTGELGYKITQSYYRVFTALKGTPEAACKSFAEAVQRASQNPEWVQWLTDSGCTNDYVWSADELASVLKDTYDLAVALNAGK